jgi:hypothetical protein
MSRHGAVEYLVHFKGGQRRCFVSSKHDAVVETREKRAEQGKSTEILSVEMKDRSKLRNGGKGF